MLKIETAANPLVSRMIAWWIKICLFIILWHDLKTPAEKPWLPLCFTVGYRHALLKLSLKFHCIHSDLNKKKNLIWIHLSCCHQFSVQFLHNLEYLSLLSSFSFCKNGFSSTETICDEASAKSRRIYWRASFLSTWLWDTIHNSSRGWVFLASFFLFSWSDTALHPELWHVIRKLLLFTCHSVVFGIFQSMLKIWFCNKLLVTKGLNIKFKYGSLPSCLLYVDATNSIHFCNVNTHWIHFSEKSIL